MYRVKDIATNMSDIGLITENPSLWKVTHLGGATITILISRLTFFYTSYAWPQL